MNSVIEILLAARLVSHEFAMVVAKCSDVAKKRYDRKRQHPLQKIGCSTPVLSQGKEDDNRPSVMLIRALPEKLKGRVVET
eukprot:12908155-Prorocentrum_lima.AAC.1